MTDLSEYLELYLKTAQEYITTLLSHLEPYYQEQTNIQEIDLLHRSAHSLKSQSLVMGYESTGKLCMELEYIFRAIKDRTLQMDEKLYVEIEKALQYIYDSIEHIKNTKKELDISAQKEVLENLSGVRIDK
jgi:chemotaxis protein histidine kinase CheA